MPQVDADAAPPISTVVPAGAPTAKAHARATEAASATQSAGSISDFSTMLARMSSDAVDQVRTAEASAISGIHGKVSVQQVVEAVMSAEQTLQTAIAVRDKVVAAYQEISRMAI